MNNEPRPQCPIVASLDMLGDRWTLVVLRDVLLSHRYAFSEIGADEGIATNVLSNRLERLTEAGVVERRAHTTDKRRRIYLPTDRAIALLPVLLELVVWGTAHTAAKSLHAIAQGFRQDREGMLAGFEAAVRTHVAEAISASAEPGAS